jgi:hypothetical protein
LASFRILPCASTMHTLALSNNTSIPACSINNAWSGRKLDVGVRHHSV